MLTATKMSCFYVLIKRGKQRSLLTRFFNARPKLTDVFAGLNRNKLDNSFFFRIFIQSMLILHFFVIFISDSLFFQRFLYGKTVQLEQHALMATVVRVSFCQLQLKK